MTRYLIIGNGVAGTTAAEAIRKADADGNITIVTTEDLPFYYRIKLPEVISGDVAEDALVAKPDSWYEERNIQLLLKTRVVSANAEENVVYTEEGNILPYDKLLLATGSHSFVPPIPGADGKHVHTLRTIEDARNIADALSNVQNTVLIGGGLLGLEAGHALVKRGLNPVVVEFFPRLLPRQLDQEGADRLQRIMESMGFRFRLGVTTQKITGNGVQLNTEEELPADFVLISAGVRPTLTVPNMLDVATDTGVVVNDTMQTNDTSIYAAGDVAEHKGRLYGIWTAAMQQGKTAGEAMAGAPGTYEGTVMSNTLKVVGISLASAGEIDADGKYHSVTHATDTTYRKLVLHEDKIIGSIMLGDTKGFPQVTKLIKEGTPVDPPKAQELVNG